MKIVLCLPPDINSAETGLVALIGRYLHEHGHIVRPVLHNGASRLLGEAPERAYARMNPALNALAEGRQIAAWIGAPVIELTTFLSAAEAARLRREALLTEWSLLERLAVDDVALGALIVQALNRRGAGNGKGLGSFEDQREFLIEALHTHLALKNLIAAERPDALFGAVGGDFYGEVLSALLRPTKTAAGLVSWDAGKRLSRIQCLPRGESIDTPLVFEDILTLRPDVGTWPNELINQVMEILTRLSIDPQPTLGLVYG